MEIHNIKAMSIAETEEMQKKLLNILLYFKDFCDAYGLMFYFCGGCLIGAVRHQGFIPWDDDIDIFMPREDYERFGELWDKFGDKERFTYCRTNREKNYHHHAASLRDNHTTFINKHSANEDICHGIALEFGPIDGCPDNKIKRIVQLLHAMNFALFNAQRLPDNKGKFFRIAAQVIYKIVPSKELRYRLWRYSEKQMSKYKWADCDYVTELIGNWNGMLTKHPKSDFDHVVYKNFEGYQMPLMAGYDSYLHKIFGDYMKLPPEEERVAKHNTEYINTEESYKKFKGVYYCRQ